MRILRLIILLISLLPGRLIAQQLHAGFTADKNGGCSPLQISFTNTTTGASATATYQWDFGNGNTSVLKDAGALFYEEKSYTVTLTVQDGAQTSSQTATITVYKKPAIDFSVAPANGCLPLPTILTSSSAAGDGFIQSYRWDFGDGTTGQSGGGPSISHVYGFVQTATVSLTAMTNHGCAGTLTKRDIVTVRSSLQASFDADQTILCDAPGTVNFTNYSTGPGTLAYAWDFGDGETSNQASPAHTYTSKGVFTVKMTVTSSEGCVQTNTKNQYINVGNFKTDFLVPALLCNNQSFAFTNNSLPAPTQSSWLIDGSYTYYSSGNNSIYHYFANAGMHTIQLTNNFGPCQQTISKQIEIKKSPVLDGFVDDITGLCGSPVQVNFKDTTADAVAWKWRFEYGQTNPGVPDNIQAPSYTYTADNVYRVSLTVTNRDGCSSFIEKNIGISKPLIGIFLDPASKTEDCGSLTVKVTTRSTEPIVSYAWNFGDGGTSADAEPTHTYTQVGIYTITLTYKTVNGCTGTVSYYNTVKVRQEPVANFNVQPTVCGNTPVLFTNTTTGYVTNYIWDFGDNAGGNYNSTHQYYEEGDYTVRLIAYNGMCNDTIIKNGIIKVLPPFPKIASVANTCSGTRGTVTFTDASRKADSWHWDFGDGTTLLYTAQRPAVEHNFTRTGKYKVVLSTTRNGCTVKDSVMAFVLLKQSPVLALDRRESCVNAGVPYTIRNLEENPGPIQTYNSSYNFIGMEYSDGSPLAGSFNNLIYPWKTDMSGSLQSYQIRDDQLRAIIHTEFFNCEDTTNYVPLKFKGVVSGFEIVSDNQCFRSPVVLRDTSYASPGNQLVSWQWNFGDGNIQTVAQGGTVSHLYTNPGSYYVNLKVTDVSGCTANSSSGRYVQVSGPKASFTPSGNNVQLNTTVYFSNTTNFYNAPGTTWLWDFGNGATSAGFSPSYTYTQAGNYTITLIAVNPVTGCRDTARTSITVKNFNTGFTTNTTFIGRSSQCPPVLASFSNTSTNYTRLDWDFGDGFTLVNQPYPSHIYNIPGTYIVILRVTGYNGLSDIYRDTIIVGEPLAAIAADRLEGCIGQEVKLHAPLHTGASSYLWDFGDGKLISAADSFAVHKFNAAGSFTPSLLVKDANGCPAFVASPQQITIHADPVVTIVPAEAVVCKNTGVLLQASGGTAYQWSPANGLSNDRIASPMALPASTTNYTITVTDNHGCKGEGHTTVTVPQSFSLQVQKTVELCKGDSIRLNAAGAKNYQWINATNGLSNTGIPDPVASPLTNMVYTVVGYDQYNCYTDTAIVSAIVRPLPGVNAGPDKEAIFGQEVLLGTLSTSDITRWNWSPRDFLSCTTCSAPVSRPFSTIDYVVTVYNSYNCMARDTIRIKASCGGDHVYIPNAFTPDHDGKNDVFTIHGSGISNIRSFRVYNRWGEIVYEKKNFHPNDLSSAWNGTFKGVEAPAGIYVYFVEMECSSGEKFERKGTIMLSR